jgi:hypothetical protein
LTHPEIILIALFTLFIQVEAQYSAVESTMASEDILNVSALAPQFVPASLRTKFTRAAIFLDASRLVSHSAID